MTGHDRLLDEIVKLSRRIAESERTVAELTNTLALREARIASLQRQLLDLAAQS